VRVIFSKEEEHVKEDINKVIVFITGILDRHKFYPQRQNTLTMKANIKGYKDLNLNWKKVNL